MSEPTFDPDTWEGDFDELAPWAELLSCAPDLCEGAFADKHEAFVAGLYLGENQNVTAED